MVVRLKGSQPEAAVQAAQLLVLVGEVQRDASILGEQSDSLGAALSRVGA